MRICWVFFFGGKKKSLLLCTYINYTIVGGLQILAHNDVIILVMRGLDNFSGGFVWVAIHPSGKADLFQQEWRLAQEQRTTLPPCGTCHQLNANVQSGPPETFIGLQLPNYKLSSPQEQSKQESVWWFRWGKAQMTWENFFFEKSSINFLLKSGLFHVHLRVFASSIACTSLLGCAGITTQQAELFGAPAVASGSAGHLVMAATHQPSSQLQFFSVTHQDRPQD